MFVSDIPLYHRNPQTLESRIMNALRAMMLTCMLLSSTAFSQTTTAYDGKWKVTWEKPRPMEAALVISGGTGTWKALVSNRDNPCVGREVPISVQSSTAEDLKISLDFSKALPGCLDSEVEFKRIDDSTLKGKRAGTDVTAVRN
jgi:hypothetical protein